MSLPKTDWNRYLNFRPQIIEKVRKLGFKSEYSNSFVFKDISIVLYVEHIHIFLTRSPTREWAVKKKLSFEEFLALESHDIFNIESKLWTQ
ncbi:MAG: hypothetical protein ACHQ1D_00460 [Nitrososphaerales archaeon]